MDSFLYPKNREANAKTHGHFWQKVSNGRGYVCVVELTILKHMDPVFRESVAHLQTDLSGRGVQGGASYALCALRDFRAFF